jgi:predicted phage terminase large subunit-like protein
MSIHNALYREDFPSFAAKAFTVLHPGQVLDVAWLHVAIAHVLMSCLKGQTKRLIVTMPPRTLKSMIISVMFVAWVLGRDPTAKFLCVSYSEELSRRHSMDCRKLMESDFYRALFPGTVLSKCTELLLETTQGGRREATSVGGTVTGKGAGWIIVDDPSKADDALNKPALDKVIDFFTRVLSSRLDDPVAGRIIVNMQRLAENDLAGFLLERGGWEHLCLPALAEEDTDIPIGPGQVHHYRKGDLLLPERMPLIFLNDQRSLLGSAAFQAQYQQAPLPAEGLLIKRDWLCSYAILPDLSSGRLVLSLDTAQKTNPANDYSALTAWLWVGDMHYLIDVFRDRWDFPTLREKVIMLHDRYRPERILIEDTGSGTALIQELKAKRRDIVITAIKPKEPKDVRIGAASTLFENRQVLFPKDAPWLDACLAETLGYPNAKHDDIIDSIAQYINWVRDQSGYLFDVDWLRTPPGGGGVPHPDSFL